MIGAGNFFIFSHKVEESDSAMDMSVVYKPPGPIVPGAVEEILRTISMKPQLPDAVVFLGLEEDKECSWEEEIWRPTVEATWLRFKGRSSIKLASIGLADGEIKSYLAKEPGTPAQALVGPIQKQNLDALLQSGLRSIFDPNEVLLIAPPGYTYHKPSGKSEKFFIKPDLALQTSASIAFVALAVFMRIGPEQLSRNGDLRHVYLDTMAISPVAYALRDLIRLSTGTNRSLMIESFHSYGGIREVHRPLPGTSICLISASTSMAMHEQWISTKEVAPSEVLTLVTISPVRRYKSGALFAIPRPERPSEGPAQLAITIIGETFLPSQEPSKKVLLSEQVHGTPEVSVFSDFAGAGIFDLWRKPPRQPADKPRALYVNGSVLIEHSIFDDWLKSRVVHFARAATKFVVHQDDSASRELAEKIVKICTVPLGLAGLTIIALSDIENHVFSSFDGLIICAAVVGKGSRLLELSAALRDRHKGPRLYILGVQIAETLAQLNSLKPNLVHSKSVPHEFQVFRRIATGSSVGSSFENETAIYYSPSSLSAVPQKLLARAMALGSVEAVGHLGLLPGGNASQAMEIREGFAYWRAGYKPAPLHAEVVGTVAMLLQNARENSTVPFDRRLASQTYQHVVLSPENFSRYNDGVIQSAILRSAFPSEIDYRTDAGASSLLRAMILRMVARAGQPSAEGLLEFLLALVSGRLQLVKEHHEEVIRAVQAASLEPDLKSAVDFVLAKGEMGGARAEIPF